MTARVHIGTSGWHYAHWMGPFYPRGMRSDRFLTFYAERFRTVEINASFYRLPARKTFAAWREGAGPGFVFALKASRYTTHMKKLKDPQASLDRFFDAAAGLAAALGPVLFQLPPRWRVNAARLEAFLDALPEGTRAAFEFRDPTWFVDPVYESLSAHGAAFCIYDLAGRTSPLEVTADLVYLRLHGPRGAYEGRYGRRGLAPWAERIDEWRQRGLDVFCYFDNDEAGYAPRDAATLTELVG